MQRIFLPWAGRQAMLKARWLVDHNMKKLSIAGKRKSSLSPSNEATSCAPRSINSPWSKHTNPELNVFFLHLEVSSQP